MKKVGGRLTLLAMVVVMSVIFFCRHIPAVSSVAGMAQAGLAEQRHHARLGPARRDSSGHGSRGRARGRDRGGSFGRVHSGSAGREKIPVESVKRTGPTQITFSVPKRRTKPQIQKLIEEFPTFTRRSLPGRRTGWCGNCGRRRSSGSRIPRSTRRWRRFGTASTSSAWRNR